MGRITQHPFKSSVFSGRILSSDARVEGKLIKGLSMFILMEAIVVQHASDGEAILVSRLLVILTLKTRSNTLLVSVRSIKRFIALILAFDFRSSFLRSLLGAPSLENLQAIFKRVRIHASKRAMHHCYGG